MANDNKEDSKKNVPNTFVWFLMAAFLMALLVQNFLETKFAKVSFSYQLESLVDLQLIQLEDSRKTAINDNLVTFSGKFREKLTEESKNRFKFLELLNTNHDLKIQQEKLEKDLAGQKSKIMDAADWFLHISGTPLSKNGYVIIDALYNNQDTESNVTLTELSNKKIPNLLVVEKEFRSLGTQSSPEAVKDFEKQMVDLLAAFRSPVLGIGDETHKQQLKSIEGRINEAIDGNQGIQSKTAVYGLALEDLLTMTKELDLVENHVRLLKLRSLRNYQDTNEDYGRLLVNLHDNEVQLDKARQSVASVIWFFNNQELSSRSLEKQDPELYNHWFITAKEEWNNFNINKGGFFKAPDQPLNIVLEKTFKSEEPALNYSNYLFTALPLILILGVLYFVFTRQMKGMGSSAMSFGKSPAKLLVKGNNKITFKDVAGIDEAIEELQEIVEFLKNPQKFTALGGHIPKGVLCVGPPGTGKTLIAKAVAGEADRPFFTISGSDFVEMFVGVGASRIRDLFDQAKKNAPCIIFIDEIDAVGRHRGAGIGGGHDEREQTLNQLLVEMDGFDTNEGVILVAATNRPDVLDKALLRPGRFDRRVIISLPDIKGRFDILKVHARKIKIDPSVDLMAIARSTPGSSGADLANLLNEAALLAAKKGRSAVTAQETVEARDKVLYGKERRSLEIDEIEKKTTAYHESGHAIVGLVVKHADPVDKVTIIPRGMSLGSTMFLPKKNRLSYWKNELVDQMAVLMGGRCAEEIFVHDISSGAKQDIERATQLARSMVCEWGMTESLGPVSYDERSESGQYGFGGYSEKKYSEETAKAIDVEVRSLLDSAHAVAKKIIEENKEKVELMTLMLIEFETLDADDVMKIIKGEWKDEDKRERLKRADELHKKAVVVPPPLPPEALMTQPAT